MGIYFNRQNNWLQTSKCGFESYYFLMQTKYKKPDWAVEQIIRDDRDGMVEDICEHGIGHPNLQWLKEHGNKKVDSVHGCDGCCKL